MDLQLSGKRALVTGGSQGIGRAIAARLLQEGASVAICARDEQGVATAVKELSEHGRIIGEAFDAGDEDAVRQWVATAADILGGIDIVVSNASASGQHGDGREPWDINYRVDVLGCVAVCEAAKPYLEKSSAASIVQIGTT